MRSRPDIARLAATLVLGIVIPAGAFEGSARAREAFGLCQAAASAPDQARVSMLRRGLELAEEAVRIDESDALAHFAVFCTLGRRVKEEGVSLGALTAVRRLRHEIDRALELAPGAVDIMVAKAAFLSQLPSFLGGDRREASRLIQQARALEPSVGERIAEARALLAANDG